jgi:hypothetical protein
MYAVICRKHIYSGYVLNYLWIDWLIDWFIVFNATFSNISATSWRPVLVVEEAGVPGENHRPWASNCGKLLITNINYALTWARPNLFLSICMPVAQMLQHVMFVYLANIAVLCYSLTMICCCQVQNYIYWIISTENDHRHHSSKWNKCRIYVRDQLDRWNELKEVLRVQTHAEVTKILLDR